MFLITAGLLSMVKAKRSYANYLLPTKSSHQSAKSVVITKDLFSIQDSAVSSECKVRNDAHIFNPGIIPPARQMFYQVYILIFFRSTKTFYKLAALVASGSFILTFSIIISTVDAKCFFVLYEMYKAMQPIRR